MLAAGDGERRGDADDFFFMGLALEQAQGAFDTGEVPIGAVLVDTTRSEVLARAGNRVEAACDATAHAEIECLREGAKARGGWRLSGCDLYCTVEPCLMCFSAMHAFRIDRVVFGAPNRRLGAVVGRMQTHPHHPFHPAVRWKGGVREEECAQLMVHFFQQQRAQQHADTQVVDGARIDI